MVICLEWGADLHMAQLMPLPLTVSCFSEIQIGCTFVVLAHPVSPRKRAVKQECVCVCFQSSCSTDRQTHMIVTMVTRADVWMGVCACTANRQRNDSAAEHHQQAAEFGHAAAWWNSGENQLRTEPHSWRLSRTTGHISTNALVQRFLGNQKTGWSLYYDLNLIIRLYFCNSNPSDEFCILGSIRLEVKLSHLNLDTVQYLFVFLEIYVSLIYIVLSCIFTECSWAVQLLLEFQGLAQECEGDSAVLSQRLKSMETELHSLVEKQLQVIAADMDTNLSFSR